MANFEFSREGYVAHIRLSNAQRANALNAAFWEQFPQRLAELDSDGTTKALIISAEGKTFCSGMDTEVFGAQIPRCDTPERRAAFPLLAKWLQSGLTALEEARFPVIAAVQGKCCGAGLDLVSACDMIVASEDAEFRIEEINAGMMADLGSLQRLPKKIPENIVRQMAYLGSGLSADRAFDLGFANSICPDAASILEKAIQLAQEIASKSFNAISASKASINEARSLPTHSALSIAALRQAAIWSPQDIEEAIDSRLNQRPAKFLGPAMAPKLASK